MPRPRQRDDIFSIRVRSRAGAGGGGKEEKRGAQKGPASHRARVIASRNMEGLVAEKLAHSQLRASVSAILLWQDVAVRPLFLSHVITAENRRAVCRTALVCLQSPDGLSTADNVNWIIIIIGGSAGFLRVGQDWINAQIWGEWEGAIIARLADSRVSRGTQRSLTGVTDWHSRTADHRRKRSFGKRLTHLQAYERSVII